jgi:hypothetical protein
VFAAVCCSEMDRCPVTDPQTPIAVGLEQFVILTRATFLERRRALPIRRGWLRPPGCRRAWAVARPSPVLETLSSRWSSARTERMQDWEPEDPVSDAPVLGSVNGEPSVDKDRLTGDVGGGAAR